MLRAPFEQAAPFLNDIDKWLSSVGEVAIRLGNEMGSNTNKKSQHGNTDNPSVDRDIVLAGQKYLFQCLDFSLFPGLHKLSRLDLQLESLLFLPFAIANASRKARRELSEGIVEGSAWSSLVRELSTGCKAFGLPTAVGKGKYKSTEINSNFLKMFSVFQSMLPENLRRHTHGVDGLASAITRARRKRKIDEARGNVR